MGKQWHKMTFPLGNISPVEVEPRIKEIFELIRPMIKKRKHGSPWFRFEAPRGWRNFTDKPEKNLIVLIPCLDDYTVEIYKDLGFEIEVCNNMSRSVRRVHFTRIELWQDHV